MRHNILHLMQMKNQFSWLQGFIGKYSMTLAYVTPSVDKKVQTRAIDPERHLCELHLTGGWAWSWSVDIASA